MRRIGKRKRRNKQQFYFEGNNLFMKYRILPEYLRNELKKPLGRLLNEKEVLRVLKKHKIIISVGDISTLFLIKNGITPKVSYFDFKCKRREIKKSFVSVLKKFKALEISRVKNARGTLSNNLIEKTKLALKMKGNVKIFVEGEEDLAVIPACIYAPLSSSIIYGQPDEGIVLIKVTEKMKKRCKSIYKKFLPYV